VASPTDSRAAFTTSPPRMLHFSPEYTTLVAAIGRLLRLSTRPLVSLHYLSVIEKADYLLPHHRAALLALLIVSDSVILAMALWLAGRCLGG
jgi:hypothetical protein